LTPERSGLRPTTVRLLVGHLLQWELWARRNGHAPRPAAAAAVIEFLAWRERETSHKTAAVARRALSRGHRCAGLPDPTEDPAVLEFWQRRAEPTGEAGRPARADGEPAAEPRLSPSLRIALQRSTRMLRDRRLELELSLEEADELARHFRLRGLAANTQAAYAYQLCSYLLFCQHHGLTAFPGDPTTIARFFAAHGATRSPGTLNVAKSAIRFVHRQEDLPDPTDAKAVRQVLKGHAQEWKRQKGKKTPLTTEDVKAIVDVMAKDGTILALRDTAILLLSYTGALRRSEATSTRDHVRRDADEIDALRIEDVSVSREGLEIRIRKSKTDQRSEGQTVYVSYATQPRHCAVLAVLRWMEYLAQQGVTTGPLFVQMVAVRNGGHRILPGRALGAQGWVKNLKLWAERAGFDPGTIGGHSLRRGHVTEASRRGAHIFSIARQGRWASLDTVLQYHDEALGHRTSTSKDLGL
jgi:hypothetical protein